MNASAVRFEGAVKRFGATAALDGFSADVPKGSITALLGRNGAGKTTALKCLVGLLRPDAGRVLALGCDAADLAPEVRARVGYVSERPALDARLTIAATFDFARAFYSTFDQALAADLLRRLDLDPRARVGALSLGQGRKVALALNLAFRPELLVLDEPAANLDAIVRREFLETVLELFRAEGMTVLLSTHQLQDVERLADRVILIEHGRLRLEAGLDELKDRVKLLRVAPANGAALALGALPGELSRRPLGGELLVTVAGFDAALPGAVARDAGARVDVVDLPLEDIFIAFGSRERAAAAAESGRSS